MYLVVFRSYGTYAHKIEDLTSPTAIELMESYLLKGEHFTIFKNLDDFDQWQHSVSGSLGVEV